MKQSTIDFNKFDERVYILDGTLVAETMYEGKHCKATRIMEKNSAYQPEILASLFKSLVEECIQETHLRNMRVVKGTHLCPNCGNKMVRLVRVRGDYKGANYSCEGCKLSMPC
jgi:predicted RNA-binding Zn-ribbon protein involved in translation (DUF1610 family)